MVGRTTWVAANKYHFHARAASSASLSNSEHQEQAEARLYLLPLSKKLALQPFSHLVITNHWKQ